MAGRRRWDPRYLKNINGFWRFDQGVTLVSGAISQITDFSGHGKTLTQATAGKRPAPTTLGGQPAAAFTLAAQSQIGTAAGLGGINPPYSVWLVHRMDLLDAADTTIVGLSGGAVIFDYTVPPEASGLYANPSSFVAPGSGLTLNALLGSFDVASGRFRRWYGSTAIDASGALGTVQTGSFSINGIFGSTPGPSQTVAECAFISGIPSALEVSYLLQYAKDRYAI